MKHWWSAYGNPAVLFRDTELPPHILDKYQKDVFLFEPTFCDATKLFGGFVAPHRFLIVSSNARDMTPFSENPNWGLCVWPLGRIFKVVAKHSEGGKVQLLLLEVPEKLVPFFRTDDCRPLEEFFAEQVGATFDAALAEEPLPALDTDEWRARVAHPIGMDARGEFFKLPVF